MAVQRRQQVHRPLPRDARDLVLRLRLRRQRAAGQEVLRAAHRVGHGPRRGLDGRAHAHPQAHLARRARPSTSTGAFPCACGKTNLAMLIPTLPGLEGRDGRRRHRLDEVRRRRPPLRHQPRGRASSASRRARARRRTRTRSPRSRGNSIFTNCAQTDDGDVWWEGMTDEPPAHLIDWHGNDWTPDGRHARRAPERALHRPGRAGPGDRPRVGGPGRRADRRHPVRRPPLDGRAARARGLRLGARRVPRARSWPRRPPPRPPAPSASCASTPFAMLPFCGYNMADYFAHWLKIGRREGATAAEDLLRQLVPQGRRRPLPVARLRRELAGCSRGSFSRCDGHGRGRSRRRSGSCPPRARSTPTGLDIAAEDLAELLRGRPRRVAGASCRRSTSTSPSSATTSRRAARAARGAREAARRGRLAARPRGRAAQPRQALVPLAAHPGHPLRRLGQRRGAGRVAVLAAHAPAADQAGLLERRRGAWRRPGG